MKQQIIELLKKPEFIMKWQEFHHDFFYCNVEIECYDKNDRRYSASLFFGKNDPVYLINTGYSIGVAVKSDSFIYGDVIKFTDIGTGRKYEVCFSEVSCNE
jgi:hypothetical protein